MMLLTYALWTILISDQIIQAQSQIFIITCHQNMTSGMILKERENTLDCYRFPIELNSGETTKIRSTTDFACMPVTSTECQHQHDILTRHLPHYQARQMLFNVRSLIKTDNLDSILCCWHKNRYINCYFYYGCILFYINI